MANWRGIEYTEVSPRSPDEQAAQDGGRTLRTLQFPTTPDQLIDFNFRESIRREFLGFCSRGTSGTKTWVLRTTPHHYPASDLTGEPHLYCQSLVHSEMVGAADSEEPFTAAEGDRTAFYPMWRCTFEYRTLGIQIKDDDDTDVLAVDGPLAPDLDDPIAHPDEGDALRRSWFSTRYISRRREPGSRVVPIRTPPFYFIGKVDAGGRPIPTTEPIPLIETWDTIWYTWTCPWLCAPGQAIGRCTGAVNDLVFDGHDKGTLLLVSHQENIRRDPLGQWILELAYKFQWTPKPGRVSGLQLGHNAIYSPFGPDGPGYYAISTDGTDDDDLKPFRYEDMSALFRPDQPP